VKQRIQITNDEKPPHRQSLWHTKNKAEQKAAHGYPAAHASRLTELSLYPSTGIGA